MIGSENSVTSLIVQKLSVKKSYNKFLLLEFAIMSVDFFFVHFAIGPLGTVCHLVTTFMSLKMDSVDYNDNA